ncbi:MAG: type II secretion system F family protein [Lachnospiraceae bacterium]|nr:type II secretion system F family protein [Lachnospiraceae bacterium]
MVDKICGFIYGILYCRKGRKPDKSIVNKLVFLHPSEDIEKLYRDFCIKRIRVTLVTIFAGLILGCFMKLSAVTGRSISGAGFERNEWNGKKEHLELYAISGEEILPVDVILEPRLLSEEELDSYSESFEEEIGELILGDNTDLMQVSSDLTIAEKYDGYPFKCVWRSSDPKRVSAYGGRVDPSSEAEVTLTVTYSYGDYKRRLEIPVRVVRPVMTEGQMLAEGLSDYLAEDQEEKRTDKIWTLPTEFSGTELKWENRTEDDGFLIMAVFAAVGVVIYMAFEKDLTSGTERKKENMRRSYPKILRQLALYIGAGMTVKAAFTRIAEDAPEKGGESIFEEMKIACLEMKQGISEAQVYERFGKRTGLSEYIRLSGLLSQNLKRGNPGFTGRLKDEAYASMHERLLESRKAGEKAQTKLLAPMMMMLAVVMVMIMMPAMTGIKI